MPTTSGNYSLPPSYLATDGQTIRTEQHNPPLEDIAQALTERLTRDGSAPMTAGLPMGGHKITNLAEGTDPNDAVRKAQVDTAITTVTDPLGVRITDLEARDISGLVKIQTVAVSNDAAVAFTAFDSTKYSGYLFSFAGITPATTLTNFNARLSTDGGSTWLADYAFAEGRDTSAGTGSNAGSNSTALIRIGEQLNKSFKDFTGTLELAGPELTGHTALTGTFAYTDGANFRLASVGGRTNVSGAVNTIQFLMSSGNIQEGTISMCGVLR